MICGSAALILAASAAPAADVLMWHNDKGHLGVNHDETILTPLNVNDRTFGKLFSYPTDGYAYAQPLVVSDVDIPGRGKRTIVIVATEHDSVYAFDASAIRDLSPFLWHRLLIDLDHRITPVPCADVRTQDLVPEIGITCTPAIDRESGTVYVVTRTKEIRTVATTRPTTNATSNPSTTKPIEEAHYVQQLHALAIDTGEEQHGSPVLIGDTWLDSRNHFHNTTPVSVAGHGAGQQDGVVQFNALREHQRSGLVLDRGLLYVDYASHGDNQPVHGWILAFDAKSLQLRSSLCTSPDGSLATSWMAGASPAIDAGGDLYFATGNGDVTAPHGGRDYGEAVVRVSTTQASAGTLSVADYFIPGNFDALNANDLDLGSGGVMLMPDLNGSPHPHRLIVGGKEGLVFLLDRDRLGHVAPTTAESPGHAVQLLTSLGHMEAATHHEINIINTPACFGDWLYYTSRSDPVTQFLIQPDGRLQPKPLHRAKEHFNFAPPTPSVSANGNHDGIVWVINNGVPATLLAYDAADVSKLLYDSNACGSRDRLDGGVKFSLPTIANGNVFVGTQDNLTVFGLLPSAKLHPANPTDLLATVVDAHHIDLSWQLHSDDETAVNIERSKNDGPFQQIDATGHGTTSYADRGDRVASDSVYRYRVTAINSVGNSHSLTSERLTTPAAAADPALIAHWTMDEGTGSRVADAIGDHAADGTIHGEVVWAHGHVGGGALGFHGAGVAPGYVEVSDAAKLRFTKKQSFTISAWVEPAAPPDKSACIVGRAGDQPTGYGLWSDEKNRWCFGVPADGMNIAGGDAGTGWHFVVGVQDATANRRQLFVDGAWAAEKAESLDADAPGDLWIGGSKGDDSKFIDARIDDVCVFDRALSAADIRSLYQRHNPNPLTKFSVQLVPNHATKLRWSIGAVDPDELPSTIRVERSIAFSPFSQIASLGGKSTRFDDEDASDLATTYRLLAENSVGDSDAALMAAPMATSKKNVHE